MGKPNAYSAVSSSLCSEVVTLFLTTTLRHFLVCKFVKSVSGPTDTSVLAVSCDEGFHSFAIHLLGMLGVPASQKALLKTKIYYLTGTRSCLHES